LPHLPARTRPQRPDPRDDQILLVASASPPRPSDSSDATRKPKAESAGALAMAMTDPIADFLTRIRNAIRAAHETVEIPSSKLKSEVARILAEQGYIDSFAVVAAPEGGAGELIQIRLKYTDDRRSAISGMRRVSRPGRRTYV